MKERPPTESAPLNYKPIARLCAREVFRRFPFVKLYRICSRTQNDNGREGGFYPVPLPPIVCMATFDGRGQPKRSGMPLTVVVDDARLLDCEKHLACDSK